jgi:hypothetical protein
LAQKCVSSLHRTAKYIRPFFYDSKKDGGRAEEKGAEEGEGGDK